MKRLAYIVMAVGWLCIIAAIAPIAYNIIKGSPHKSAQEASHSVPMDSDADPRPYVFAKRFMFLVGGGIILLCLGDYLRSDKREARH